ncbi:ninjurin-1 [Lucilia sericata]|uniref:ninjurin-1 n=1 Tax=Lucilia sericata TaxID=13632 RepID=UPI0018A83109|nr:ninjurin-1 [Lucilia sericata]
MATSIAIKEGSSSPIATEQSVNDSDVSEDSESCCKTDGNTTPLKSTDKSYKKVKDENNQTNSYAENKNTAEGLMDIALLSANANQLRFLITYNHDASTYYISITLVALSLLMQILVGIALIFKRRFRRCRNKRYNEFILGGVFIITVVNILLAAFTTTDVK